MKQELKQQWEEYSCKMEQLMRQFPAMQEMDRQRTRLRLACQIAQEDQKLQNLLAGQNHMQLESKKYHQTGNEGLSVYIQNQIGYLKGPLGEQQKKIDTLLKKGGFTNIEDARMSLPENGVLDCMDQEIQAFQQEYAKTLSLCQELDQKLASLEDDSEIKS